VLEFQNRIRTALQSYDAVIATGVDNFTYLTGIVLPFASNYHDRKAVVLKTAEEQEHVIWNVYWLEI
jgi:putative SOS response-associated peptidase YedK